MGGIRVFIAILMVSGVLLADTCTAYSAPAALGHPAKTFAVFLAAFNSKTGAAQGGVAGTAFFVSKTSALTAYHVLQPKSFTPPEGFTSVQVWLVHEGERAIELHAENLKYQTDRDMTSIELNASNSVDRRFIFSTGSIAAVADDVRTDGFLASSTGPSLKVGATGLLEIVDVPWLSRIRSEGKILRAIDVDLNAIDVHLSKSPCYQLSYEPIVGLSGGPVISGDRVIAMNSFADPGTRHETWAVDLNR
jgi:hypothetical protein